MQETHQAPITAVQWVARFRGFLISVPVLLALLPSQNEPSTQFVIWPVSAILFLSGLWLRIWAQQHIRHRLKIAKQFTITGPYALTRNPIYLANTLICLAIVLFSGMIWLAPITLVNCVAVYSVVIRNEESHLLRQYGDAYREYTSRVPRWLPRSLHARDLELVNEYFRPSFATELQKNLRLLGPFIMKEFAERWFR